MRKPKVGKCPKCGQTTPLRSGDCLYCGALIEGVEGFDADEASPPPPPSRGGPQGKDGGGSGGSGTRDRSDRGQALHEEPRLRGANPRFQRMTDDKTHYLIVGTGEPIPLDPGKLFVMGRDPRASLVVHSQDVSRQHAEIDWKGDPPRPVLAEVRSRYGTFVNGSLVRRDAPEPLRDGDEIRLGPSFTIGYRHASDRDMKELLSDEGRSDTREIRLPGGGRGAQPAAPPPQPVYSGMPYGVGAMNPMVAGIPQNQVGMGVPSGMMVVPAQGMGMQQPQQMQGMQGMQGMQQPQQMQSLQGMQQPQQMQGMQQPQQMQVVQGMQGMQQPQQMQSMQGMQQPQQMQGMQGQTMGFQGLPQGMPGQGASGVVPIPQGLVAPGAGMAGMGGSQGAPGSGAWSLAGFGPAPGPPGGYPAMIPDEGDLANVPGSVLLETLHRERRSGLLTIFDGTGSGEIVLVDGRAKKAVFGTLASRDALEHVAQARAGAYRFRADAPGARPAAPPPVTPERAAPRTAQRAVANPDAWDDAGSTAIPPEVLAALRGASSGGVEPPRTTSGHVMPLRGASEPTRPARPSSGAYPIPGKSPSAPPPSPPAAPRPSGTQRPTGAPIAGQRPPSARPPGQGVPPAAQRPPTEAMPYPPKPPTVQMPAARPTGPPAARAVDPEVEEQTVSVVATIRAANLTGDTLGKFVGSAVSKLLDEGSLAVAVEVGDRGLALAEKGGFEDAIAARIAFKATFKGPEKLVRAVELLEVAAATNGRSWCGPLAVRLLNLIDPEIPPDPKDPTPLGRIAAMARSVR